MAFKDIQAALDKQVETSQLQTTPNGQVSQKGKAPVDANGMPLVNPTGVIGTQVARPGTEKVILDGSTFVFVECLSAAPGKDRKRYVIVEKGVRAKYGNQFIMSTGERAHIITRDLYNLLLSIIQSAGKQLGDLSRDNRTLIEQRDLYKLTIDALRKNGIID